MKGLLPLTKCVLLSLTLLIPPTHGRAHPWRRQQQHQQQQQHDPGYQPLYGRGGYSRLDGRLSGHGRLSNAYKTHFSRPALPRLLEPLSDPLDPLDATLEDTLLSNDLDHNLALSPEDVAPYTTRLLETYQGHGRDRTRHHLTHGYQNYHEEVCATEKDWNVLTETVDLDGNAVVIIKVPGENQTYFSYKCVEPCQSCKNVIGKSRCKQRYTYVKMLHYLKDSPAGESDQRWDFVEVPSHCACELVPPHVPNTECTLE